MFKTIKLCIILKKKLSVENLQSLRGYMDEDGKFKQFPGKKQKKNQALFLEYLATKFEKGKDYTEMDVNEILNQHHTFNDPASLRRLLFGSGLLGRTLDGKKYWRN